MEQKTIRYTLAALAGLVLTAGCFSTGIITGLAMPREMTENTGIDLPFSD